MAKKGRSCELCSSDARMFCESDEARLCWDCDEKVHAANFLVAKHTRTALCHVCHCQTPWKASGPMVGRTVSVCGVCVARSARGGGGSGEIAGVVDADVQIEVGDGDGDGDCDGDGDGSEAEDEDEYESDDEDVTGSDGDDGFGCDEEEEDDDDDENQVVPWSSTPPSPPPVSVTSTSCTDEEDSSSSSRFRDFRSTREIGARGPNSSSMATRSTVTSEEVDGDIIGAGFGRPLKYRRVEREPSKRFDDFSR